MKFILDENLPNSTLILFQELNYEVEHIRFGLLRGAADEEIAKYAKEKKAILVTKDLEFGSFIVYPPGSHYGVIILKLPSSFITTQINHSIKIFLQNINIEILSHAIIILEVGKYRRREIS